MDDIVKVVGAVVLIVAVIFFSALLGTVGGIIGGWIVGIWFSDLVLNFLDRIGMDTVNLAVWQVGGALGFLGSFFKSFNNNTNKN